MILSGFILAKFLLQYLLFNSHYDLHRDEYLHLDQANHLAWGYSSVPPLTSWISYCIKIFGNSIFWIRFFPALFGMINMLLVWKCIETLKGNLYALILAATCILFSSLLRINFLYQPNSFDILCWTGFYFTIINYFGSDKSKWLYYAAIIFAVGFLNKYNVVFMLIGLIPALLLTRQRVVFTRVGIYYAALIALVIISPNLYWQYMNDFPVCKHLQQLTKTQLVHVERTLFLKEQLFYNIGALPVICSGLYALFIYAPFKKYQFFILTFFFTLGIFTFFKAKGYYALGLYPIYIAFGAAYLGNVLNVGWKKHLRLVFLAIPILFYAFLYQIFYSIEDPEKIVQSPGAYQKLGLLRWEDGKNHSLPQDFADMLGWKELAKKVELAYSKMPPGSRTIVLCDNYGQAGAINYYVKNKDIKAVAFNADYINWFELDHKIDHLIRVKEFEAGKDEMVKTSPVFRESFVGGMVSNPFAREYKTTIFVFKYAKIDVNQRLRAEVEMQKRW